MQHQKHTLTIHIWTVAGQYVEPYESGAEEQDVLDLELLDQDVMPRHADGQKKILLLEEDGSLGLVNPAITSPMLPKASALPAFCFQAGKTVRNGPQRGHSEIL